MLAICPFAGVCTEPDPNGGDSRIYIITELMSNGSLLEFLRQKMSAAEIGFARLIDILSQVAEGMAYLEAQHIIHRNLRAANVLVGDELEVKLSGFERAIVPTQGGLQGPEQTYLADEESMSLFHVLCYCLLIDALIVSYV